ncbi:MAG TPA: mandelate racemase/muconate lactonizing enzyme family protein, partial [Gaiella sp.]|nr:mandelate racemase/muconate lactonizing enzyme family protein [Gaiella sp.]
MEAVPVALPLVEEFHWQGGAQVGANLVLFAVHTEDGVVGWGESICEVPLATAEFGKAIARQVVGGRVDEVETILDKIWSRGRWKTTPQFTQFVVSGIESACWDALGRTLGRPTHALFGGAVQNELDFFGFPQGDDAASLAAGARRLSDHEVIYLKIGRPRDDDAVVAAVREAIGPEKTLRVDPNEAWD